MCQIPLKFYEFDDPNNQVVIKTTTIQTPAIEQLQPTVANNQITKIEFQKSDGTWQEPTSLYKVGTGRSKYGYPYVINFAWRYTHIFADNTATSQLYNINGPDQSYDDDFWFVDIPSTSGKIGIRLWSGKNIVMKWVNYSESHTTENSRIHFKLTNETTQIMHYLEKILPINSFPSP